MDLPVSTARPTIMHIDLNSCFAIIEQQANPLIRHKPVAVAAYDTPKGIILASSYEAKALGIKLGVTVGQATLICRDIIVMMPDPDKYLDAQSRFKKVLLKYTDEVKPKSVDEFVIDFKGSPSLRAGKTMEQIGLTIKQDIKGSLGEYVTVNVGIATNRFLAKLAAGLHKPDGMDKITSDNLRQVYASVDLLALPGINLRYKARLNACGIFTPLDFLDAPLELLKKQVFHGISGLYWYMRLRGLPIDTVDFDRKSIGQQYALGQKTDDLGEISRLLMKLCEKTGRRLRRYDYSAQGIHLALSFEDKHHYSTGKKLSQDVYSTQDIYSAAQELLKAAVIDSRVTKIAITVFNLHPSSPVQLRLFDDPRRDSRRLARAADLVNDRYGEFTLTPANMAGMKDVVIKRVAFGNVSEL